MELAVLRPTIWARDLSRLYQKKSPTPSGGGGSGNRTGWRSRRSITTAGAPGHQHHVIATAAATAQAKMQAEQGSIGELRGYHNLRSRRHTLANVRPLETVLSVFHGGKTNDCGSSRSEVLVARSIDLSNVQGDHTLGLQMCSGLVFYDHSMFRKPTIEILTNF
ncbi:hypothetical protein WN55_09832 [Dufourea novaeangliae]|uniref:Uncharacterized protein n=1 Tax=Dufourea novaeangliae TaxID=178035 RepID=A0A154P7D0_DUFNO|nr:hypothetical protein WN55_09832 [Dufourea novaeangliae]